MLQLFGSLVPHKTSSIVTHIPGGVLCRRLLWVTSLYWAAPVQAGSSAQDVHALSMARILRNCSDPLSLTLCAVLALQSIEDVEDTRDGATMHLQELSALIDQVRANIEAIHGATPKP